MNRKSISALFITLAMIGTSVFPVLSVAGQSQEATNESAQEVNRASAAKAVRVVDRHREGGGRQGAGTVRGKQSLKSSRQRPAWAQEAFSRSLNQLQSKKEKYGVRDAGAELRLLEALKDGRGYTDVRLTQTHNGVEVYGGQLITHLDDKNSLRAVSGRVFEDAHVDTTPKIDEARAIEAAKAALGHDGEFAEEPTAKLVILPRRIMNREQVGAVLVHVVTLRVGKAGGPTNGHQIFVSAEDGSLVWRLDDRHSVFGGGNSIYDGFVGIDTTERSPGVYTLKDPERGQSEVLDANDGDGSNSTEFTDDENSWGDLDDGNRHQAGVSAHYGVAQSWDYFYDRHYRLGADGNGTPITSFVHYVSQEDSAAGSTSNASGGGNQLTFGDGDGRFTGPWVSVDIVGHEFTHCVIEAAVPNGGLIYSGESGAVNESFADIFGTAIEFYINNGADPPDYLLSEDIMDPDNDGITGMDNLGNPIFGGRFLRNMANPQAPNYLNRVFPDHYTGFVTTTADNGGVHTNSSIMNHAFYLLAEGGTHSNGTYVPAVGRRMAEDIFYIALERGLAPSATFRDVAGATRYVAAEYLQDPDAAAAVELAWLAVGVFSNSDLYYSNVPAPGLTSGRIVLYEPATGFAETGKLNQDGTYQNLRTIAGGKGWTHIVSMGGPIFYYNAATGQG
ncbi:MAG: M4 family metallopeptidase, partial [Pyrinomonadaceae bacterium]